MIQKTSQHNALLALTATLACTLAAPSIATTASQSTDKSAAKSAVRSASWIELTARTDKAQYKAGEPIQVSLRATNIQSKDAYLKFASGQRFDIQLFRAGQSEPVYTWSANKMFAQMISHIKLKQGQSETYDAEIGSEMGELAPGRYRLRAHLTNSSQIGALPVEFSVAAKSGAPAEPKLQFSAETDKENYRVGEAVKVKFSLRNAAQTPATLNLGSGQTYDVFVRNAAGDLVWSWGANKRFIMATRQVELAAGETQNFAVEWDGRALPNYQITPGQYTVEAIYKSAPEIRAQPVTISVG